MATMTHPIGTREEWLTARLELLMAEMALTHQSDEVTRQRHRGCQRFFEPPDK